MKFLNNKKIVYIYALLCVIYLPTMASCAKSKKTMHKMNTNNNEIAADTSVHAPLYYKVSDAKIKQNQVLLILMHGYGSNENDLLDLAQFFPNNIITVCPRAPYQIGPENYQWYTSIKGEDGGRDGDAEELFSSRIKIEDLISFLQKKYKISASHTIIGGFSQGANMSYMVSLNNPGLIKGVAIFSGFIFDSAKRHYDNKSTKNIAFFIGHGDMDNRIPYSMANDAQAWLNEHNYNVEFHTYHDLNHAICQDEINAFTNFLNKEHKIND